jgi:DNA-binding beta-propeller fold protein YncE
MRKINRTSLVSFTAAMTSLLCFSAYGQQASPSHDSLLVVNRGDRTLAILDPESAKFVATIALSGITGHEVAATPDGKTAFVPIYGNSGVAQPGTDGSEIDVIDLPSRKVVKVIGLGHGARPHCAVMDPGGKLLYVTTELDQAIIVIDVPSLTVVGKIPTGAPNSHMLAVSRDGATGYTANVLPGSMSVMDMKGRKLDTIIPISANAQRVSISIDQKSVFTSEATGNRLAVIDAKTNQIARWITMSAPGYGTVPTLDGRWLLVAHRSAGKLSVIDLKTFEVSRTIDMPAGPSEIVIRPDGKFAYISCDSDNKISILNLANWKVEQNVDAGKGSDGLAWATSSTP